MPTGSQGPHRHSGRQGYRVKPPQTQQAGKPPKPRPAGLQDYSGGVCPKNQRLQMHKNAVPKFGYVSPSELEGYINSRIT